MARSLRGRGRYLIGHAPKPASREHSDVAQHRPEMAGAPCHDEDMPQFMEPERPGYRIRTLESVDQRARAVDHSPGQNPGDPSSRHRPKESRSRDHGHPSHSEVERYREPARGVHPEELEQDATKRQSPD